VNAAQASVIQDKNDLRGITAFAAGVAGLDVAGAFGAAGGVVAGGVVGVVAAGAPGLGADSSLLINLPWDSQKGYENLLIQCFK
jgi:hypothetical protein